MKENVERPSRLIDITRLPLAEIQPANDGGLRLGALVTNTDVAYNEQVLPSHPYAREGPSEDESPEHVRPRQESALRKYTDPRHHRKHCGRVHSIELFRGKKTYQKLTLLRGYKSSVSARKRCRWRRFAQFRPACDRSERARVRRSTRRCRQALGRAAGSPGQEWFGDWPSPFFRVRCRTKREYSLSTANETCRFTDWPV
jgi:hypothetical protein